MRKLLSLLLASVWTLGFVCASPVALADVPDLHTGSFDGRWCNYDATVNIESKETGKWVFHGHILIKATGQFDELWVEQYDDNSLRMIRSLQGTETGQTQVVQTNPPQEKVDGNGAHYALFTSQRGYGIGCDGTQSSFYVY
jgi:hypothetical protein